MVICCQKRTSEAGREVSGPLLDPLRVDIHVDVPRVPYEKLTGERLGEPSSVVSARVEAAQERQRARFVSHDSRVVCNADMTPADVRVREACKLDATGQSLMRSAMQQLQLSARAFHRVLEDRADDCGPGGQRRNRPGASGRGDSILSEAARIDSHVAKTIHLVDSGGSL